MKKYLAFFLSVILIVASCMNTLIYVFAQNETVFKIDFEGQQGTFIQNNPVTDSSKVASIEQTQSNGNVMHIKKLNVYRTDGWNPSATILWPSIFRLPNNNGTDTLYFEKDQVLKVNFKIKKNEAYASSEFFSEITVALVFADSYDGGATNNVRTYVDNNQTVTLTEIDLTADNNFVEYETTISVPKSGYAAFLLYGQQWGGNCNIYVDDITITETKNFVTVTDSTLNTYDEQGATYQNIDGNTGAESNDTVSYNTSKNLCGSRTYQNNTLTIGYFDTVIEKYDDTNGYAAHFGYHANALDKGNGNYDKWPQMLRIYDSDLSDLGQFTPKANTTYTITFDYRFDEKTSKDKSAIFNLVYTKAEEPSYLISGKTEDILVKEQIAVVPMGTKTDGWVKAAATFTTGGNVGALFLTLNSSYWWSEIDAWVDNIEITSFSDMSEFSLTVHNNDGKNGDASFTVNPLTKINELDSPYSRLGAFEGYYLDSALSKKAEGYIGNAKELWVKWRTEKDKTVNTYDEKNVEFVTEKDGNNYTMTNRIIDGKQINENYFAHYNVTIDEAIKNSKITNAVKFMNAQKHTWNWPAIVKIYDNKYDDLRLFVPKPNSAYKIKFKYSTDENTAVTLNFQIRALNDDGSTKFNETKVYNDELVSIKSATLWNEAEAIFYTGSEVTPLFLTLVSTTGSAQENIEIYIDDVVVEEVFGIRTISFDTVGGEPKSSIICCPEEKIPVITPPTKEGFVFEGWFLDSSYTIPFSYSKMPNSNIELFAKWSEKIENAYDFISDFESNLYSNTGVNNISNNVISQKVEWKNADDAYSGKGYIRMHPVGDVSQISHEIPTFALLDNDFNTYKIVPGARYRITFAMRCEKTQQVNFACSQQVPSIGVNQYNSNIVATQNYHDLLVDTKMGEWGTYELYVMPSVGGKLYVMAYGDSNCYVDIDDLKIEKVDESVASTVTYYLDENTIKETKFGKVGTTLTDVAIANTETQIFNGWRYADGKLFTDGFFQNKDVKVYASWKDRETTEISTQWKSKIIDFEDSENAKIFYSTINNSSEANRGTYYVMGDSKNARSGNSYFRLENAGAWVSVKNNLRYRFFDKDSSNHMVNLEPASVYRVTFWINLEKVGYTSLMISTFENNDSMDEYLFDTQIILSDASQIANLGKWIQLESNVVTGSEPSTLGMVISGGWISGCIDDIEITKLENVTLSFDSNGGSKVEPIKVMSYSCAVEPEYPEKEGYTFAGWYADKQLTKKFNFNKTKLVTDTMVYAKWIKDFVPEKYSKEFYTYEEIEIEKPNEISDNYLDAQINISNIKSNVYEETEEDNLILPISIISGAILFTGLVTFFIILMVKRKKRKEK